MSCNGVSQCWPAQRGQAIVPGSSPYMVHGKWIQACAEIPQEPPVLHPAVPSSQATSTVDAIPTVPPALQNKDSTPKAPRTPRTPRTSSRITKGIPPTRLGLPEH